MNETTRYYLWAYSPFGYWSIKVQTINLQKLWATAEWDVIGDAPIAVTSKSNHPLNRQASKLEYARNTSPDMLYELKDVVNKWVDRRQFLPIAHRKRWRLAGHNSDDSSW